MPTIRITDFPMVYEIRNEYKKYRQDGFSRAEATEKLKISYHRELADAEDDAPMFWIGLAEGQCHYHELTESVSREASSALEKLKQRVPDLSPVDIRNRQELYARAPMPEKAKVPKSRKFRCKWKIGDTYAYRLQGNEVQTCGLAGKSLLMRKVDEMEFGDGRLFPVVMFSICPSDHLPKDTQEYNRIPLLMMENRRSIKPYYFEFRGQIIIGSTRTLNKYSLEYVGNFADADMPEDEVIIEDPGMLYMVPIQCMDMYACTFWRKQPMFREILQSRKR